MMLSEDPKLWQRNEGAVVGQARTLLLLLLLYHTCCALEITVPTSHIAILQTDALLPCTFKVPNPPVNTQFLAIFWHFEKNEIVRYDSKTRWTTSRFTIDEQAIRQGNASLTIPNVAVSDEGTYKCTVVYSPRTEEKQIQLKILAVPVVKIQKKAVQSGVPSLLQCSISNFFPKDMKVIWLQNDQILSGLVTEDDKTNADNTFTRNSSIIVTFLEEQGNPNITCQVTHEYLQDLIKDFYIVQFGIPPTVNIKTSRSPDGSNQIYMCEATNYSPEKVTMHWLLDGKKIEAPRNNNTGSLHKEIYYRIQLQANSPPSQISCEVQHETLNSPIKKTEEVKVAHDCKRSCHFGLVGVLAGLLVIVPLAVWYFMKRDSQRLQVGKIHRILTADDEKVTMYCTAFNCPEDVKVTWTITESNKEKIEIPDIKHKNDEEANLIDSHDYYTVQTDRITSDNQAMSALSFTPNISKHREMEVSCKFHGEKRSQEKHLKCSFTFKKPEVLNPVQLSLGDGGDVLCSVFLQKFYPKAIKINWSHGLGQFQDVETICETFPKIDDFTYNVKSVCRVPGHLFKDQGYRVRVTWNHNNEPGQQEVTITDSKWRPVMEAIDIPEFIDGREARLLCRVSGYFPDNLDVKWLRRDAESQEMYIVSPNDKYKIPVMESTQQEDKTFTYTACLIVSVSAATDYGSEFICRVRHPSLKTPLEQRTGEISVTGIQAVNVMLVKPDKLRAEVLSLIPKDIKITWSHCKDKKNYKERKDMNKEPDSNDRCITEIKLKNKSKNERKYYKVTAEDITSHSVVEKNIVRENGEFYLIENENKKTLLEEISEQHHGRDVNVQIQEPPAGVQTREEALPKDVDKKKGFRIPSFSKKKT